MTQGPTRAQNRKAISDLKLSTLLEITNAINNNLPEDELFILFEDILKKQLNIGRAAIYLNRVDRWEVVLRFGLSEDDLKINIEEELTKVADITVLDTGRVGNSKSFDVVIPVFHQSKVLAYMLMGDLDENARRTSPVIKHLGFIQTLANITAVAVENKRLELEFLEQERLKQELRMASKMQAMLLPKQLPDHKDLQVDAFYKPHLEVGGDFYDIIEINEDETVLCMADVSGKGMSAAILMANFQANLRANVKVEKDLKQVMHNLNRLVWDSANGERYITCFLSKYNRKTRELDFVNAAHPSAILMNGKEERELSSGMVGIGMFDEVPFIQSDVVKIKPEALMLFFTDGITETNNPAGEQFQENKMAEVIRSIQNRPAAEVNKMLIEALDRFRGTEPYMDDVALVSCRFV